MEPAETLFVAFDSVEDPRIDRRKQHPLSEALFLVLSSVICGVQSWCGVEEFGNDRLEWLRKYYPLCENGMVSLIPCSFNQNTLRETTRSASTSMWESMG